MYSSTLRRAGTLTILTALAVAGAGSASASDREAGADWPQWGRTVHKNMYQPADDPIPTEFDPGQLQPGTELIDLDTTRNVKWVAKLGSQTYGNPAVAQGRVFVGTNNDGRDDPRFPGDFSLLKCLDEETGETLWTLTVPKLPAGKVNDWEYLGVCSSPAVVDDFAYIITNRGEVLALDIHGFENGNTGPFTDEAQYMARDGEPAVELDEDADADIIWRYDMIEELGVFPHNITSSSPLVVGDYIYVTTSNGVDWSHTNIPSPRAPSLIALDRHTGELAGEEFSGISRRILHGAWSSPSYGEVDGQGMIFFGGPDGILYAFDPIPVEDEFGDGELVELWRYDANPLHYRYRDGDPSQPIRYARPEGPSEIIATPVFHKGRVYAAVGQDPEHGEGLGNLVVVEADPSLAEAAEDEHGNEYVKAKGVWEFDGIRRSMSTVAIADGLLFVGDYSGFIYCLDPETGEELWQHDSFSHIWGSPLVADGKVFAGNEDGDIIIFAADREKNIINTINMYDPVYSTPIAANGVLYIATMTQLYAITEDD